MKKIIFICVLLLSACSDPAKDSIRAEELKVMLDDLNFSFVKNLNSLEDKDVSLEDKKKILCSEFPDLYKNKYIPATLEYHSLTTQSVRKDELLNDWKNIINGYSKKLNIQCK